MPNTKPSVWRPNPESVLLETDGSPLSLERLYMLARPNWRLADGHLFLTAGCATRFGGRPPAIEIGRPGSTNPPKAVFSPGRTQEWIASLREWIPGFSEVSGRLFAGRVLDGRIGGLPKLPGLCARLRAAAAAERPSTDAPMRAELRLELDGGAKAARAVSARIGFRPLGSSRFFLNRIHGEGTRPHAEASALLELLRPWLSGGTKLVLEASFEFPAASRHEHLEDLFALDGSFEASVLRAPRKEI